MILLELHLRKYKIQNIGRAGPWFQMKMKWYLSELSSEGEGGADIDQDSLVVKDER